MSDNVIDIGSRRDHAKHQRKEERLDALKERFEKALPTEEHDPRKKLLKLFKKKPKKKK